MPDGVAPLQRWSPNPVHRELLGYRLHKHAELDHALLLPVLEPIGDGPRPLSNHVQPPGKSSPVSLQISHGGLLARRQRWRITSCFCAHLVVAAATAACVVRGEVWRCEREVKLRTESLHA